MLGRVAGDEDIAGKIRLYKQVLGACLCPMFPIIVLFVGHQEPERARSLKSCAAWSPEKLLLNWTRRLPRLSNGESMIGKLLNVNTDIDLTNPHARCHGEKDH